MTTAIITHSPVSDAFLDDAATEALQANPPLESEVFARTLGALPADRQDSFAQFTDIAAQLAAAAPYMDPPESLRGRILQRTAPGAFNMADYRRKVESVPWFWRWGMAAAVVFLVGSAYRNYAMQANVVASQRAMAAVSQHANLQALQMRHQSQALAMLMDPRVRQLPMRGQEGPGKPTVLIGKFLFDPQTRQCMLVMPRAVLPPTAMVHWTVNNHGVQQQFAGPAVGLPDVFYLAGRLQKPLDQNTRVDLKIGSGPSVASFSNR